MGGTDHSNIASILDGVHDGAYLVDADGRIQYWSPSAERITGYRASALNGVRCRDGLLCHVDGEGRRMCGVSCPLAKALREGCACEGDAYLKHAAGHRIPAHVRVSPLRDKDGRIVGAVQTFVERRPPDELRKRLRLLEKAAMTDSLTGLANRAALDDALGDAYRDFSRYGRGFGFVMADVDRFKVFNDRHGHLNGDRVLQLLARAIGGVLPTNALAARWGGDEFAVVLPEASLETALAFGEELRVSVRSSSLIDGSAVMSVSISVGVTMAEEGESPDALLARADRAMYRAKGRGGDSVFDEGVPKAA